MGLLQHGHSPDRRRIERATEYAHAVIADYTAPDSTELSPMRISESRLILAFVAGRDGDLKRAVDLASAQN